MGDRFIPTRSLMDIDRARSLLLDWGTKRPALLASKDSEYRRRLEENLTLDSEGRPFRMLPFWRPSTRNSRRTLLVDDMMQEERRDLARYFRPIRRVPSVRSFNGHERRVGSLSWNHYILTSGSGDCSIINHDARSYRKPVSQFHGHSAEVCHLRWSEGGRQLASGGNDNLVCVWESLNMRSSKYLHRFNDHKAAVRALAWCPHKSNVLASGGGFADRCIKIWNTREGKCTASIETSSQVCALEWNRHQKEILSAHGYDQNQLTLWSYPSMSRIADLKGHTSRVLHLSQSPDGTTVASASADQTICFWKVFEPPRNSSRAANDGSNSILSLKRMHIR